MSCVGSGPEKVEGQGGRREISFSIANRRDPAEFTLVRGAGCLGAPGAPEALARIASPGRVTNQSRPATFLPVCHPGNLSFPEWDYGPWALSMRLEDEASGHNGETPGSPAHFQSPVSF